MKVIVISLLLCACIGSASTAWYDVFPWNLFGTNINSVIGQVADAINSMKPEIINRTCIYLAANQDRAGLALMNLNQTLLSTNASRTYFNNTLAFINSPTNQLALVSGTISCPLAIDALQKAVSADLSNIRQKLSTSVVAPLMALKDFFSKLASGNI